MNWFRQNTFLSAYIGVVIIGVGILGYFIQSQNQSLSDATEQFNTKVKQLQGFQNSKPFPNEKNLQAMKEELDAYTKRVQALEAALTAKELPIEEITPEDFQDNLRKVVSDVEKRAAEVGTILPKDFYMGFDKYKSQLPVPQNTGLLNRQLTAISIVVNRLLELKVSEILDLKRAELPNEMSNSPANKDAKTPIVVKSPLEVTFRTDQAKTRLALNSIADSEQGFFVIRSLVVENSNSAGPSRISNDTSAATENTQEGYTDYQEHEEKNRNQLSILLGRESLTVELKLELISFNIPEIKF